MDFPFDLQVDECKAKKDSWRMNKNSFSLCNTYVTTLCVNIMKLSNLGSLICGLTNLNWPHVSSLQASTMACTAARAARAFSSAPWGRTWATHAETIKTVWWTNARGTAASTAATRSAWPWGWRERVRTRTPVPPNTYTYYRLNMSSTEGVFSVWCQCFLPL